MFKFLKRSKKIDIVLQATGTHSWNVGEGWKNAATALGFSYKLFKPKANWGDTEPFNDDNLYNNLSKSYSDIILLLGFDWHSQALHTTERWKTIWNKNKAAKILYVQESILNNCKQSGNDSMFQAFLSASSFCDLVVYTDILDKSIIEKNSKKSIWMPFGVDVSVFKSKQPIEKRKQKMFFRGQTTPYYGEQTYSDRRYYMQKLAEMQVLDIVPYQQGPVSVNEIANSYNEYAFAVNFPSIFAGHPTRVTESMASGCICITNLTGIPENDSLFQDKENILYYDSIGTLLEKWKYIHENKDLIQKISEKSLETILSSFSLEHQLKTILNFI